MQLNYHTIGRGGRDRKDQGGRMSRPIPDVDDDDIRTDLS